MVGLYFDGGLPYMHKRQAFRKVFQKIIILLLVIMAGSNTGWAQNMSPADAEELHWRSREQAQERQEQKDIFLQAKTQVGDDRSLPIEELSFAIDTLQLEGQRVDKFPWAQEMLMKIAPGEYLL